MRQSVFRRHLLVAGIVTPALAVTAAFVPTAGAQSPSVHRSALLLAASPSQPATQKVIVLLKNQFRSTPASRTGLGRRAAAIASEQAPLLASVRASGASHLRTYRTANAFAATVSAAESSLLSRDPNVLAVVPDRVIHGPVRPAETPAAAVKGPSRTPAVSSSPTPGPCPSDPSKPILEPEALQAIHAAYQDNTPSAQQVTTGSNTRVGYMADGIDPNNQDFIRSDGTHVFFDYQDFTGDPAGTGTLGGEAFGDASSIAAQGLHPYDLSAFVNEAHPLPTGCNIVIRGVAPGASLAGYDVFGSTNQSLTSNLLQAIDWAVTVDHVDVLNQSFGGNPYPDTGLDPVQIFDDAAVFAGVTVVASSGDAGNNNSIASPASDPLVISTGASTTFRLESQETGYGFQFSNGTWLDDNPASFSSGGITQGGRTFDLLAPGADGWALCSTDTTLYAECTNYKNTPTASPIEVFGGTSEAAPLSSGVAALVISEYRSTHGNLSPTPALVKQILTGTADDLTLPAGEQGAGLVDARSAVLAAASSPGSTVAAQGSALLTSPSQVNVLGRPGQTTAVPVQVTNDGATPQTVTARLRSLTHRVAFSRVSTTLSSSSPVFTDGVLGLQRHYSVQRFTVPAGVARLDAVIHATGADQFGTPPRVALIDPTGAYANYTYPQGPSSFGETDVRLPRAGTWTALVFASASGYTGPVTVELSSYGTTYTAVSGSLTLAPKATGTLVVPVATPLYAGDIARSLELDSAGHVSSIPVVSRALVATDARGGTFSGYFTGGNGREGDLQQNTFEFVVPPGQRDLDTDLSVNVPPTTSANDVAAAFLVSPTGDVLSVQRNAGGPASASTSARTLEGYQQNPQPGVWRLVVELLSATGTEAAEPFSGHIGYDAVRTATYGVPVSSAVRIPRGRTVNIEVAIKNTGTAAARYFLDARGTTFAPQTLVPSSRSTGIALPLVMGEATPLYLVPSQTKTLTGVATGTKPLSLELQGVPGPEQFSSSPDLVGDSVGHTSVIVYSTPKVQPGIYASAVAELRPFPARSLAATANIGVQVVARPFDRQVTAASGDLWLASVVPGASAPTPVAAAPGGVAPLRATVTPTAPVGTVVRGWLFVDTYNPYDLFADELAAIPYAYTVG